MFLQGYFSRQYRERENKQRSCWVNDIFQKRKELHLNWRKAGIIANRFTKFLVKNNTYASRLRHYKLEYPLTWNWTADTAVSRFCLRCTRFTQLLKWRKHKKMETIPFSYAYVYAYVTPGFTFSTRFCKKCRVKTSQLHGSRFGI